jgi:hypothetical protein
LHSVEFAIAGTGICVPLAALNDTTSTDRFDNGAMMVICVREYRV